MYASRRTAVCLPKTSEQARSALGSIRRVILQAKRLWQREDNAVLYRLTQVFSYKSGVARAYRRWFLVSDQRRVPVSSTTSHGRICSAQANQTRLGE